MNNLLHPLVEVCQVIVRTSGQAVVMVGIILAMQWLLKNRLSPGWRYGLWCLLVVRLVLPASLESGLSIFNVVKLQSAQRTEATQGMPTAQGLQATELPGDSGRLAGTPVVNGNSFPAPNSQLSTPKSQLQFPLQHSEPTAITPQTARVALHLGSWEIAALVWIFGVLVFGVRLLWTNLRFRARLRDFEPISDHPSLAVLEECRAALRVRQQVELIESDLVQTPGVYGFWRKRLLVPEGTFERFDRSELRCIFLHELAHLRRRDLEVNWMAALLQVLHWFNPVLWFAFSRMRADRELATDALALSAAASTQVTLYGETIIRVLEGFSRRPALPGVVGIAENLNHIKQRMKAIAQFGTIKHWKWLAAAVALTVGLATLTDAQPTGSTQTRSTTVPTAASNSPVSLPVAMTAGEGVVSPVSHSVLSNLAFAVMEARSAFTRVPFGESDVASDMAAKLRVLASAELAWANALAAQAVHTSVSTNYTPAGADASYLEAVKIAVATGGPGVALLGLSVGTNGAARYTFTSGTRGREVWQQQNPTSPVNDPSPDSETIAHFGGARGPRVQIWKIAVTPGSTAEPSFQVSGGESRRPIVLSDWIITWQKARDIASADGGRVSGAISMLLSSFGEQLVWQVYFTGPNGFYTQLVDAKTGEILTRRQNQLTTSESHNQTRIRIRNGTSLDFKNVVVGDKGYGDINSGGTTEYQTWATAYRYSSVSLLADQNPWSIRPIDYVGETPLGAGDFTYLLTIQNERLQITLVDDKTVANLQEQFAQETDPATKALKSWLAAFGDAPQGGKPSAGPLIEQYGDRLPVIIGQMAVKGDPLIESEASGVEPMATGIGEMIQALGPKAVPAVSGLLDGLRRVRTATPLNYTAYTRIVNLLSRVNADSPALEGILSSIQGPGSAELYYRVRLPLIAIASRGYSNTVERLDKFVAHADPDTRMQAVITMFTCCEPSEAGKAAFSKFLSEGPRRQTSLLTSNMREFKGRERAFFEEIADLFRRGNGSSGLVNLGKDALPVIKESLMSEDATVRQRGASAVFVYVDLWHSSPGSLKDVELLLPAVAEVNPLTFLTVVRMFQDQLKELSPAVAALVRKMVESESVATSGSATRLLPLLPPPPAGPP